LILKIVISRLVRIIGMLTQTGVPIVGVLELARENAGNLVVSRSVEEMENNISRGGKISDVMRDSELFPPLVVRMVSVGESTGRLEELLLFVSDYYDQQVKYTLKNLTTYIEPVMIFILGGVVLFIALAVFLPMWNYIQLYSL
jgi:type II secretory pathway component PulF